MKHKVVIEEDGTINIDADPLTSKLLYIEEFHKMVTDLLMD